MAETDTPLMSPSRRAFVLSTLSASAIAGRGGQVLAADEKVDEGRDWLGIAGKFLYVTEPTKWSAEVESWRGGKIADTARIEVYLGDFSRERTGSPPKTLVRFTEEGIRKGRLILYEGERAWMYFRGTNQAIRIPLAEQLVGDADVASILNVDLRQTYEVAAVGTESGDSGPIAALELRARKDDAPFASAQMRLQARTARPIDARFHSLSGKLIKTVEYVAFQPYHDQQQLLQSVRITVHVNAKSDYTLVRYTAIAPYELPRRYFSPALMKDL